jgi:flagellar basal-body rod modification protein FlgD
MTVSSSTSSSLPASLGSALPDGMTTLAQLQAQKAATQISTSSAQTAMGENDFLTLFTTQLKNQDPSQPEDNSTFVSQLAQFSQLTATTNMESSMNNLVSTMQNDQMSAGAALIGKQVLVPGGSAALINGQPVNTTVNLPKGVQTITMTVSDSSGNIVDVKSFGAQPQGNMNATWAGTSLNGTQEPDGLYKIAFTAVDSTGATIKPTPSTYSTVLSISNPNAGTSSSTWMLNFAGGGTMNLANVSSVTN